MRVTRLMVRVVPEEDGLVHQAAHVVEHLLGRPRLRPPPRLPRAWAAREVRQPGPRPSFRLRAQLVTPVDRYPRRPVPRRLETVSRAEHAVSIVETFEQVTEPERPHAHGGQLDRQRQPVEPATQLTYRLLIVRRHDEPRRRGRGAEGEQRHRRGPLARHVRGMRQWRHPIHDLAGRPQRLAACRDDVDRGGHGQQ